jgi:type II secretion system protein L
MLQDQEISLVPSHLRVLWEGIGPEQLAKKSVVWSEALGVRCTMESDFKLQAMQSLVPHATNLLSGEFAAESPLTWRKLDSSMRLAVIMLAISVGIWVLGYAVQTWVWGNRIQHLKAQAEMELRRGFPDTRSILDPQLQMQRGLADLRAQAGYYAPDELPALLGRLSDLGESDEVHLMSLDYQNQNAVLAWHCDSADQAQTLLGRLKQLGLEGTLKADTTGQTVMLRLGGGAP